jgi:hypothetical protein
LSQKKKEKVKGTRLKGLFFKSPEIPGCNFGLKTLGKKLVKFWGKKKKKKKFR